MRETRAIAFVTRLTDDRKVFDNAMKRMLIRGIAATDIITSWAPSISSTQIGTS
jgi:hypothetical protein